MASAIAFYSAARWVGFVDESFDFTESAAFIAALVCTKSHSAIGFPTGWPVAGFWAVKVLLIF